jgi:hypothetical protein
MRRIMAEFERKVQVQVQDIFPAKSDLEEIDSDVRSQRVPGELIISYPGNGGRSAVVFKGKPVTHAGEIEEEKIIPQISLDKPAA